MTPPAVLHTRLLHVSRVELWGRALAGAGLPAAALPPGFELARLGPGDPDSAPLRARLAEAMSPVPPAEVARRLAAGRRAYVIRAGEPVVSYGWVSFDEEEVGELEGAIRVGPGEAYIWDCATLPAWRGRGLYPALLRAIARELAAEGFTWVWIAAAADNFPSLRGFVKAGYARVGVVRYVRIGRWRRLRVAGDPAAPPAQLASARRAFACSPPRTRPGSPALA